LYLIQLKNGSYTNNFDIANRLFNHVFKNFNIKESDMYLAGFSGGSRLATAIASLTNKFKGVVGCGAGFSENPAHSPSTQNYIYVGICGNEDPNYREMLNNKTYLHKLNFKNTLITYDNDHRWPPEIQINRAFRFLNNLDDPIEKNLEVDLDEARRFKDSNQILFAAESYDRIIKTYPALEQTRVVKNEYLNYIRSKDYKNEYRLLDNALKIEEAINAKLYGKMIKDFEQPEKANLKWWKKEVEKLKKIESSNLIQEQKMAKRVAFNLFILAYSRNNPNLHQSNTAQINFSKEIISILRQIFYSKV